MSKKTIIIISIVAVLLGVVVFGIVLFRARMLSDFGSGTIVAPQTSTDGLPLKDLTGSAIPAQPVFICGDGTCSEGERNCNIDCGSGDAYFQASVVIQPISSTSVRVIWKTKNTSTGVVNYGTDSAANEEKVESMTPGTAHEVMVNGLSPDRNYYFGIGVSESGGGSYEYGPYPYEGIGESLQ